MKILLLVSVVFLLQACSSVQSGAKTANKAEIIERSIDLGVGYLQQGDYSRAKANLIKALELDNSSVRAHNTLAIVFQKEGEFDLAEKHFLRAIEFDAEFAAARNNYGAFLFSQKRTLDAIEQLQVAAENRFYNRRHQAFENLGVAFLELGSIDAAEVAFERAIALNPNQSRALLELAMLEYEEKEYSRSRTLYLRYIDISAQNPKSLSLCIGLFKRFSDRNRVASCHMMLKNVFPNSTEYQTLRDSDRE
jgi:type IV pilus assembly protein PilF